MKNQVDISKRPGRLMTVGKVQWKVHVGKSGNVIAYSNDGRRKLAKAWDIKGVDAYCFQRGQWKHTADGACFPSDLARWLMKKD